MNYIDTAQYVLKAEANALLNVKFDETFPHAIGAILACNKLVTTGLGKAGLIAAKAAASFSSTGTPAVFLHPSEAGHGDLGILQDNDCILAYSTSGKTREVLETLRLSRMLGNIKIIGITSHPDSQLRQLSDIIIDMGTIEEPCPLGLTPSASSSVMLGISDALTITVMKAREFTKQDYGIRHHAGYLGEMANSPVHNKP